MALPDTAGKPMDNWDAQPPYRPPRLAGNWETTQLTTRLTMYSNAGHGSDRGEPMPDDPTADDHDEETE